MLEKYLVVSMDEHPRRQLIDPDIEILPWRVFVDTMSMSARTLQECGIIDGSRKGRMRLSIPAA